MLSDLIRQYRGTIIGYASALSGTVGRLAFSLIYFVTLANTLTIGEFGQFATAVATGIVLSRIGAFGFFSPLYRIATVKRRLIGTYTAGYLFLLPFSLPIIAVSAWIIYSLVFAQEMAGLPFALIIVAEVLFNRGYEIVMIVTNGMGRFGHGAIMAVLGSVGRAGAAIVLTLTASPDIIQWSILYLIANAAVFVLCAIIYYPRQKLRLRLELYWRRMKDALSVSVADVLFYLQMELDKLLVLSLAGANLAGLYAIIMRLVELTAMPIRVFNMMFIQSLMRDDSRLNRPYLKSAVEAGIFVLSCLALTALAIILYFYPNALGRNVATAAALTSLALLIPGFRNLIEYHAELLYARGQTVRRTINMFILGVAKAGLLIVLLRSVANESELITWANVVFAVLYLLSVLLTYPTLKKPGTRI